MSWFSTVKIVMEVVEGHNDFVGPNPSHRVLISHNDFVGPNPYHRVSIRHEIRTNTLVTVF